MEHVYQIYDNILADFEVLSAEYQTDHMTASSDDGIEQIVDYVYDNYDNFRLLLKCGDSGKYADFIHNMLDRDAQSTLCYMQTLKTVGMDVPFVGEDLLHMISTGFFSAVFQIIEHDIDKSVAKANIAGLKEFQTGGWKRLLGIRLPSKTE